MIRVLPEPVATRLNDMCGQVVVLFADIVGFTAVAARHTPAAIVGWLNTFFEEFDRIVERHGLGLTIPQSLLQRADHVIE